MAELLRWLLLPGIFVGAWYSSQCYRNGARKAAMLYFAVVAVLLVGLAITGVFRREGDLAEYHGWTGHVLVIVTWLGTSFAAGVLLQQCARRRPVAAVCQLFVLLLVLGSVALAAFTGYLGPSHAVSMGEETRNRFIIVHLYFLPGLTFLLLAELWWFFSRRLVRAEPAT